LRSSRRTGAERRTDDAGELRPPGERHVRRSRPHCTTPLVGKTGTIVCEAGLLASGGTCRFVVTVRTATGREKELTGTARVKWGLVDPSTEDNAAALTYVR
jgi:hypothetical protein